MIIKKKLQNCKPKKRMSGLFWEPINFKTTKKEEIKEEFKKLINNYSVIDGKYYKYIVHLTIEQIKTLDKKYRLNLLFDNSTILDINYKNTKNKIAMILFLTKSQIKNLNKAKRDKTNYKLKLSYNQLQKIGYTLFKLNKEIENLQKKNKLINILPWLRIY